MPASAAKETASVALVHGEDDFAVKQRARQLYQQWCEQIGGMDHEILDAQVANSGEALKVIARLRESLQTLPFFGTGKVVWVQNCNFLGDERAASAQAVSETLAELSQELKGFAWENVRLLVSAGKVDKRKTFYKTLEKLGRVECFEALTVDSKDWASQAEAWAARALQARGKRASDEALAELVASVGPNHRQLESEAEKLSLYVGGRADITARDVRAVVTRSKQARAFALGDALGERDLPRLLRTLDEELWTLQFDSQRSEIGLLYGLIAKVRAMILAKELQREGWLQPARHFAGFKAQLERVPAERLPQDKRFNPLELHPYVLFKALEQADRYSLAELVRAMGVLLESNQRLVSSKLEEALVLQQALVQIVRREGEGPAPRPGASSA